MKQKIVVNLDSPNQPKTESLSEISSSIFIGAYKKIYRQIHDICRESVITKNNDGKYVYNIVPIIGDRGSGKTSVLRSVLKNLSNDDFGKNVGEDGINLNNYSFITLKHIDVGHLEAGEDLFGIVLARMLSCYRNNSNGESPLKRNAIFQEFSKIYTNYSNIIEMEKKNDNMGKSALTVLSDLDASQNLKSSFYELTECFIKAISDMDTSCSERKERFVVIPIDDIDINLNTTYKMLEQIQNYMMIPNVIIFITASKINLECICGKRYIDFFKEVLHIESRLGVSAGKSIMKSCNEMAFEYLNKLMPTAKIINLNQFNRYELYIRLGREKGEAEKNKYFSDKYAGLFKEGEFSYPLTALSMISRATGIFFYARRWHEFFLAPKTLRAKAQFINKIKDMEPYYKAKGEPEESPEDRARLLQDNLAALQEDIVVRHIGEFSENLSSYIRRPANASTENFCPEIYRSLYNVFYDNTPEENPRISKRSLLSNILIINKNNIRFFNIAPLLDEVRTVYEYSEQYTEALLALFTVKLYIELENQCEDKGKCSSDFNDKRQIMHEILHQFIGTSYFGKLDNKLSNEIPSIRTKNVQYLKEDEKPFITSYDVGYKRAVNFASFNNKNNLLDEANKPNAVYIDAVAFLMLFLSSQDYEVIVFEHPWEEYGQDFREVMIEFKPSVDFSMSSFFINIFNPDIISDFYDKLKVAGITGVSKERMKTLISAVTELSKLIPVLNVELMYNAACNIKDALEERSENLSPFESCRRYFERFGEELGNVYERYSKIYGDNNPHRDFKDKYSRCIKKIFLYTDSRPNDKRNNIFSDEFDGIIYQIITGTN